MVSWHSSTESYSMSPSEVAMGTSNDGHTHPVLAVHLKVDMMVVQRLCHGCNQTRHKPQLKRPWNGRDRAWELKQDVSTVYYGQYTFVVKPTLPVKFIQRVEQALKHSILAIWTAKASFASTKVAGNNGYGFAKRVQITKVQISDFRLYVPQAHVSPTLNRSLAIQHFKPSDATEIHDGLIYIRLSQTSWKFERAIDK